MQGQNLLLLLLLLLLQFYLQDKPLKKSIYGTNITLVHDTFTLYSKLPTYTLITLHIFTICKDNHELREFYFKLLHRILGSKN